MRLLARRDFMMMMTIQDSLVIWAYTSSWGDLGGLISGVGGGGGELISEEAKKYFETNYSSADLKTFCI